ncbi:hypothetical protein L195_g041792 [Trifolium pratense]|uniref:Uncharacterized protein n=1 Tax=Trifolium pratense TaxID=57577 RepID=A0A2K3M4L3_TRIPR|nr:hypothetical protein L195_g041792 [Trifolium pratense]
MNETTSNSQIRNEYQQLRACGITNRRAACLVTTSSLNNFDLSEGRFAALRWFRFQSIEVEEKGMDMWDVSVS